MGIEEKRAIGKRKLESGIRSVLGATRATTRPVRAVGSVGMSRPMGMVRLVGVVGLVRMIRLMRMIRFMGVILRFVGVVRLAGMVWLAGMIRVVGRLGSVGAVGPAMAVRATLARMFNFFRFRPVSMFVAFQFLAGTKISLKSLSAFGVCWAEVEGIPMRNP